jgi:UDPglucose--hexose-1-phosphate uridylyltransferase
VAADPDFDLRRDPLTGALVVVTGSRQARPNLAGDTSAEGCPFCPGGLEAPEGYVTRWFPNRWPAIPGGRAEVLLYTPDHDATLSSLGVDGIRPVLDLWRDRTAALGARDDVAYVLLFENRGDSVGATIPHPHGQVYAYPFVPPVPAAELEATTCALCEPPDEALVVSRSGDWTAWVPDAALWPFELRIAPGAHLHDLVATASSDADLAAVLVDALGRLDRLFGEPMPSMLWWHQAPSDGGDWPAAHVHLHVAPTLRAPGTIRYVAGAEVGGGVYFNPVVPVDAAARLRAVGSERRVEAE